MENSLIYAVMVYNAYVFIERGPGHKDHVLCPINSYDVY